MTWLVLVLGVAAADDPTRDTDGDGIPDDVEDAIAQMDGTYDGDGRYATMISRPDCCPSVGSGTDRSSRGACETRAVDAK